MSKIVRIFETCPKSATQTWVIRPTGFGTCMLSEFGTKEAPSDVEGFLPQRGTQALNNLRAGR